MLEVKIVLRNVPHLEDMHNSPKIGLQLTSYDNKPKSSIRIYTYKKELRHTYEEIDRKINDVVCGLVNQRLLWLAEQAA